MCSAPTLLGCGREYQATLSQRVSVPATSSGWEGALNRQRAHLGLLEACQYPDTLCWAPLLVLGFLMHTMWQLDDLKNTLCTHISFTSPRGGPYLPPVAFGSAARQRLSVAKTLILAVLLVYLCSCAARTGASDVHHPQAGGPLLPWTQGGEWNCGALPFRRSAGTRLLHCGHAAGAPWPGAGHGVHHPRAADPREPGSAHAQGQQFARPTEARAKQRAERGTPHAFRAGMGQAKRWRDLEGYLAGPWRELWASRSFLLSQGCSHFSVH